MDNSASAKRRNGLILVILSALVFSTAGLFSKGIDAGAWDIIFWRGACAIGFTLAYMVWRGKLRQESQQLGWSGLAVAVVGAASTAAFISAFKLTSIANVSLIYAASPFMAGLVAWAWIGELMNRQLVIASMVAFAGVLVIVSGSLGSLNWRGDALALLMTFGMAMQMAIYRRFPETPAAGPSALSSLLLLPVAALVSNPMVVPMGVVLQSAVFGLLFAFASVTLSEGARRLPAAETALLSSLETPIAPLLAWAVLGQVLAVLTVVGGTLILAAVIWPQIQNGRAPRSESKNRA